VDALFHRMAARTADAVGSAWAFVVAVAIVVGWALTGPLFGFSDSWQLTINTTASIVPSLMVFLIQNTQNRDAKAVHLKLDELLRASSDARNQFIQLERLSDGELDRLEAEFRRIRGRKGGDGGAAARAQGRP
jgi:low affinity Fe/Cu permease